MSKKNKQKQPFDQKTIKSIQDIGSVIQQVRKESHLTQQQAARLCRVAPKFLSELETGKNKHFSLQLILRVMHIFGIQLVCKLRKIQ